MTREQKMEQTCHCEHLPPLYTCLDTDGTQPPAGNSNHYVSPVQGRLITVSFALSLCHISLENRRLFLLQHSFVPSSLATVLHLFSYFSEMMARIKLKQMDYN